MISLAVYIAPEEWLAGDRAIYEVLALVECPYCQLGRRTVWVQGCNRKVEPSGCTAEEGGWLCSMCGLCGDWEPSEDSNCIGGSHGIGVFTIIKLIVSGRQRHALQPLPRR